MGNKDAKIAREMRNPPALNLVEFRRKIRAGDLILIGTRKVIESDISLPPQLLHSVEFTNKNKFSISHDIDLPVWDSAALVVDMSLDPNSGKSILELTKDGFILSEFISRMSEIKRKNYDICVRFLECNRGNGFRENLIILAEYLAGKSIEELSGTPAYEEIYLLVSDYLNDTSRNSALYAQLREAFYMIVTNIDDLCISKTELHDLMREFTGANMDITVEELAAQLDIEDNTEFKEFYKKWSEGPGRSVLGEEIYVSALHAGQFLKYCYKTLGVIQELQSQISTPDDFATNYEFLNTLRSNNLQLLGGYSFSVQTPVKL